MTVENGKIIIHAFHESETEEFLEWMKKHYPDLDLTKCYMCGSPIIKTLRPAKGFREKWHERRSGRKYYDWNIGGISNRGVLCEKMLCVLNAQRQARGEESW